MKKTIQMFNRYQTGALGVFMCVVMVIVFGLINLQNSTKTSLDLYLSNSKQHIEEARQLAYAGIRHYHQNYGDDAGIQDMINTYNGDLRIVGECSYTTPLPDTLVPEVDLVTLNTPNNLDHKIVIRGVVAPWACNRPLHNDNYRATFEILASVNCSGASGVDSGCVKRSFVINRVDNHNGTLGYEPLKPVRPPTHQPGTSTNPRTVSDGSEDVGF